MKSKIIGSLLAFTIGSTAMAASLTGNYRCNDGGILSLKPPTSNRIYVSLKYKDGSVSTLDYFEIRPGALKGKMIRDDEDPLMGQVEVKNNGSVLHLIFNDGDVVSCRK